jgi:hypothetical protein
MQRADPNEIFADNTLYIILYLRGTAPDTGFHWGLYHHYSLQAGGYKYHIRNLGSGTWIADHASTRGAAKSFLLVGAFAIATLSSSYGPAVSQIAQQEDHLLNSIAGMTCRVWVLRALARLKLGTLLPYCDTQQVEREAIAFGEAFRQSASFGERPRPTGRYSMFA